jgi:CRP/FNR family transcriptional regulator
LGDDVLGACEDVFDIRPFPKRTQLFDVGDDSRMIYFLKYGKVRIARLTEDGKEVVVAVLGTGDVFGEEVLFGTTSRTMQATCIEDTLVCMARADKLFGLIARYPVISLNIAKYLSQQRDEALSAIEDIAYLKVPERLVRLFERLAEEHGRDVEDGTRIEIRLTHADIASLIGSTRETVSLELSKLVRSGRIRLDGKSFIIPRTALSA